MKTIQLNKEHKNNIRFKVTLPSEIEWEWMTIDLGDDSNLLFSYDLFDEEWITDLLLADDHFFDPFPRYFSARSKYKDFVIDGALYPHVANLDQKFIKKKCSKKKCHAPCLTVNLDANGISSMGGNVSEWMLENYNTHWTSTFERRQKTLRQKGTPQARMIADMEQMLNNYCDRNGQLVRGASWADERFGVIHGKNKAGMNAKTFVAPHKQLSTVGFRYVVHIEGL